MEQVEQIGVCEWHRYVDDTVVLLEPDTNIDDVLHVLKGTPLSEPEYFFSRLF